MPKLIKPLTFGAAALATFGLVMLDFGSTTANATPPKHPTPASVAQSAANAAPPAHGIHITKTGDALSAPGSAGSGTSTTVTTVSGKSSVAARGPHGTVTVALPNTNGQTGQIVSASTAQGASDTVVFTPSSDDAASTVVQPVADGSARIMTVIPSATSSSTITYPMSLPAGAKLVADGQGGYDAVIMASAEVMQTVAHVDAPWAKDANGKTLPTSYTLSGTTLTQTINTAGATFPVIADPFVTVGWNVYLNLVGIWCRDIGAAAVAATMAGMTVLAVRVPIVGTILAVTGLSFTGFIPIYQAIRNVWNNPHFVLNYCYQGGLIAGLPNDVRRNGFYRTGKSNCYNEGISNNIIQ